jgi:ribosomal protein L29
VSKVEVKVEKVAELRKLNPTQLRELVTSLSKKMLKLRMQRGVDSATVKSHEFKQNRRQRARVITVLAEQATGGA